MKLFVVYMRPETERARKTIEAARRAVKEIPNAEAVFKIREKATKRDVAWCDIAVSIGGDGTFLGLAKLITDKTPLLGVNADPSKKEGFLCRAEPRNLKKSFRMLAEGKYRTRRLARLKAESEKNPAKRLPPSLNEVFFGNKCSYRMSRYVLEVGGRREFQRSSGVIVSTAAGSHAWASSVGGKKLPLGSRKIQVLVREPFSARLSSPKMTRMLLGPESEVRIISLDSHNIAIGDSIGRALALANGEPLLIRRSEHDLRMVEFN